ncbi:MAG: HpcH/HpaI aldolase/citrate lyase family protein, partial [Giesbergeria sp.]|nr:HpcH/HpaI aldolase/citrate lyase family protein [Giesbergeria sp.]
FRLSAPVFEYLDDDATLDREVRQDLLHGLTGKTAIHPDQVPHIERHYSARHSDVAAARRILDPDAPGVFQFDNAMCEPATHHNWALSVVKAEQHYGAV